MASTFSFCPLSRFHAALCCTGLAATLWVLPPRAFAQEVRFGQAYQDSNSSVRAPAGTTGGGIHGGEHFHAKGHRPPPPGYQEAPSMEFQSGPDPDHVARVHRDRTTGSDLSRFGTAYQNSSPAQSGSLGDATGNGWTQQRGNGW